MKYPSIQRAIRGKRHGRSTGDAPSLGRVARMPDQGGPKQSSRRSKRNERKRQIEKKVIFNWSVLVGLIAVLALVTAVYLWLRPQLGAERHTGGKSARDGEGESRVRSQFKSPSESEALAIVRHALEVRDPEKVTALFRTGAAKPGEVVNFIKNLPTTDGQLDHLEWLASMDANGLQLDGVLLNFQSGGNLRQRLAFLTPDEMGAWKIDFDSLARTVTPSWSDLMGKPIESAVVRVILGEDSYFNGFFSDDKQWICYALASPDCDKTLLGYCKVGSPQAAAIKWMFTKGENAIRATLEIRRVKGAAARQFEIVKVLADDWVMGKVTFEDGYK